MLVELINKSDLDINYQSQDYGEIGRFALNIKNDGPSEIDRQGEYLFYTNDNVDYLIGYTGDSQDITLPDYYSDKQYEIYNNAFDGYKTLKNITFGIGVTRIGRSAFYNCSSLENITIGNNISEIGVGAFNSCFGLEKVVVGDSVKIIKDSAFSSCRNLSDVDLGSGVETLEDSVFWDCEELKEIVIPKSVKYCALSFLSSATEKVYCEAASLPSTWDEGWAYTKKDVIYNYSK